MKPIEPALYTMPEGYFAPGNFGSIGQEVIRRQASGLDLARMAYSVKEVAAILGVSDKTVRRLIARKLLRCSRALRHILIPKNEIERFLDETARQ